MRPYYENAGVVIYHADALELLEDGALAGAFDSVVTDPPYCSGGRQQASARGIFEKARNRETAWFLSDNMGTDTYVWWLRMIGARLFRGCPLGAHFYCFTDWRQYTTLAVALESVGWTLRSMIVWDKQRSGAMGSFWRNNHELIAVLSKGPPRPLPNGGFFNVLHANKPQGDLHPTVKPLSVVSRLVEACGAEATILDPFMGTGTTLVAAKMLGVKAIGIEIEEGHCEAAARRLDQGTLGVAHEGP